MALQQNKCRWMVQRELDTYVLFADRAIDDNEDDDDLR